MAKKKLADKHKRQVREWLCAGYTDEQIMDKLAAEYGVSIVQQSVSYYRDKYGDAIAAAEEEAYQKALKLPWCRKSHRIRGLEKNAEKMHSIMQQAGVGNWPHWLSREFRDTLSDMRDEMGDITPDEVEVSHEIGLSGDALRRSVENLLARAEKEDSG